MLHLMRFITWLLVLLPLSNQLADPLKKKVKDLVTLLPRYYQRTILRGLQSQASPGEVIDPKEVYAFLSQSSVVLDDRISEITFQEIDDKLKDSQTKPPVDLDLLIDLSAYKDSNVKSKKLKKYTEDIVNTDFKVAYEKLVENLFTLYRKHVSKKNNTFFSKELGKSEKKEVRMISQLIVTEIISSDYDKGEGYRKEHLKAYQEAYQNSSLDRHLLYAFLVEAMQDADSSVIIDQSFRDYLVKLGLFDTAFNPTAVNSKNKAWDWAIVNAYACEIPSELSLYYEGVYSTVPIVGKPGTMTLFDIAREWTQAYRLYREERLDLDHEEEFKFQRQTEFLCGYMKAFSKPVQSPVKSIAIQNTEKSPDPVPPTDQQHPSGPPPPDPKPKPPQPPKQQMPVILPPSNSQGTNDKTQVQVVNGNVPQPPPAATSSDDNKPDISSQIVTETKNNSDTPVISNVAEPPPNSSQPVEVSKCPSLGCYLGAFSVAFSVAAFGIYKYWDYKYWDYLLQQFNSYLNKSDGTKSTSNMTGLPTWPPLSPEIEGSSSTLWVIIGLLVCFALLGAIYYIFIHSRNVESSETEKEKVPKKKMNPKLKKMSKKERSKGKVKKGVAKKKLLPPSTSPVSKATPSSVVSTSPQASSPSSSPVSPSSAAPTPNASTATFSSQTGTESLATQTPSPKATANKAKRSTRKKKKKTAKKKLNKPDVSKSRKGTTSVFSASVAPSKGAQFSAASTLPQTSKVALTKTPTWDNPTLKTTPALPSNAAASKQTQTPSSVAPPTKLSQTTQKMKRSNAATNNFFE